MHVGGFSWIRRGTGLTPVHVTRMRACWWTCRLHRGPQYATNVVRLATIFNASAGLGGWHKRTCPPPSFLGLQEIYVLCPDHYNSYSMQSLSTSFLANAGVAANVSFSPLASWQLAPYQDVFNALASGSARGGSNDMYDMWQVAPLITGSMVELDALMDLSTLVLSKFGVWHVFTPCVMFFAISLPPFFTPWHMAFCRIQLCLSVDLSVAFIDDASLDWSDVHPVFRDFHANYGGEMLMLPLASGSMWEDRHFVFFKYKWFPEANAWGSLRHDAGGCVCLHMCHLIPYASLWTIIKHVYIL